MKIMITGNDKRSAVIKNILKQKLPDTYIYDYQGTVEKDTSVVVLPTPVSTDFINLSFTASENKSLDFLFRQIPDTCLIIGAGYKNDKVYDLCDRDDFSIMNAIPTAEGAISLALNANSHTLFGSKVLVTGFGRVSRILLSRLYPFTSDITVAVRKSGNIAEIEALGMKGVYIDKLEDNIECFDIVFNTIPFKIFDSKVLSKANRDTVFIELASKEAGFDRSLTEKFNNYINAPGLPGKIAPTSAGIIMAETILNILTENFLI
ncbi:MAG: hypothetical protein E7568_05835 [Ruminococcaceae bacterium]|nr:hypothetical protein [Oscillospiraceae bacterium]